MEPKTNKIIILLDELITLLNDCGEMYWSQWLGKSKVKIESEDINGINELFNAYGGMGSLNDLVIHPTNGHNIEDSEIESTNERLNRLLESIYSLVQKFKSEN